MNSNVNGSGDDEEEEVKKNIAIFAYKYRILSIEMKTKIVQHVSRIDVTLLRLGGTFVPVEKRSIFKTR